MCRGSVSTLTVTRGTDKTDGRAMGFRVWLPIVQICEPVERAAGGDMASGTGAIPDAARGSWTLDRFTVSINGSGIQTRVPDYSNPVVVDRPPPGIETVVQSRDVAPKSCVQCFELRIWATPITHRRAAPVPPTSARCAEPAPTTGGPVCHTRRGQPRVSCAARPATGARTIACLNSQGSRQHRGTPAE